MKSFFRKIILLKSVVKYLYDPQNVQSVIQLGNAISTQKSRTQTIAKARKSEDMKQLLEDKFGLKDFDLAALSKLPQKTLGYEFYNYILGQNLDPQFYKFELPSADLSDYAYLTYRLRKTHDLWHLMTGFKTSEEGEAGLIAFYYAQLRSPLSGLIIVLSFIHFSLRKPTDIYLLLDEVTYGWNLGKKAQPLASVRWENYWATPLLQLKEELRLNLSR